MAKWVAPGLVLAMGVMSGCETGAGLLGASATESGLPRAPETARVMGEAFVIAGPKGYCIDTGATRETPDGTFAALGSCAAISGNPSDTRPRKPALLTASVIPSDTPLDVAALNRMADFFAADAGRTALARTDSSGDGVEVIDIAREKGLVLVHAADGEQSGDVSGDYWRGVFDASGHLVTITVSGFREAPLSAAEGRKLARGFVAAIRAANALKTAPAGLEPAGQEPTLSDGGGLASFFNRLL